VEGRGDDSLVLIDSKRSVDVFGVKILVSEFDNANRTAAFVATGQANVRFESELWH
jgi:hypothetical protein